MEKIYEHRFRLLLEIAIGQTGNAENAVFWEIRQRLVEQLELGEKILFADKPSDRLHFERFLIKTIDKHGVDFTGEKALKVVKTAIRGSSRILVTEYQNKN